MTMPYNVMGMVKLRLTGNQKAESRTGQLSVPTMMMAHLKVGDLYKPEFTDEGILFRFVGDDVAALPAPSWTRTA